MLNLEPSETDKFLGHFPRDTSLSEIVRQYIHDEVERIESEKKVMPQTKGALINYIINSDKKLQKQATLDIFAKEIEVVSYFKELEKSEDTPMIRKFTRFCQLGHDLGKTYFRSHKN